MCKFKKEVLRFILGFSNKQMPRTITVDRIVNGYIIDNHYYETIEEVQTHLLKVVREIGQYE